MPLPSSIVQVADILGASDTGFSVPLTAGNRVVVILCTTGISSGTDLTVDITDDSGTTYATDWQKHLSDVANGTGVLIASGIVPINGTNSTSTVTFGTRNFNIVTYRAMEATLSSPMEAAEFSASSASSASNDFPTYDTDGLGSLVVTGLTEFTGRTHTFSTAGGTTVDDFTELVNSSGAGVAITVGQTDGSDDPSTSPTIDCTFSGSAVRPVMVSFAYKISGGPATGFTATARQSGVNKNQKGFVDIAPSPDGTAFNTPTTITANSTAGTCNFIRQRDGLQSVGSITLQGIDTAVMEVFSTQSSSSIVFSWTTDNATITSPAATSFTVQAVESAFVAVTPSILWNATSPGSGFITIPIEASTVSHGSGFSQVTIVAGSDRAYGEYITDSRRTVCIPSAHGDPSGTSRRQICFENQTPVNAYNGRLPSDGCNIYGSGFEFPDVSGAYLYYYIDQPFNGKESVFSAALFYDHDGTLPKITSTITNLAGFFAAFATDPVNRVSLNTLAANTTITLSFTSSGDILTIPGSWTSSMPFVIKGASRTTSIIQGESPNWYSKTQTAIATPSITFENLTYVPTNIGQLYASATGALIFKDCDILETLGEFSKNFGVTTGSQWAAPFGVFFINCKVRAVSCEGVAGIRSSGDGLTNLIPDVVVGFDFFQCAYTGYVLSTYAKRFSNDDTMPEDALTYVTVTSSAFNVGTNSNLTKVILADMPQYSGTEWLTYTENIKLAGESYPVVIGRTDVANGVLYVGGDLTASMTAGTQITLSAAFQARLHYVETLVVTGATNNHDGTATLTWADSSQPEGVSPYENMQFATTTTTTALQGLRFSRNSAPSGRSVTVNGELAGSAATGDLIWFMQEAHADANQIGLQGGQGQNPGPIIEMNSLNEGFQTGLFQPGASYTVSGFAMINVISVGVQFQLQQQAQNIVFQNNTILNNILQNTFTSGVDFYINDSIAASTSATAPTDWNNGVLFTNSHGIDEALPNGIGNTTGAITYDAFYNSTTSALQGRVWNTNVAFDLYGNAATTNGSTYSRIGAVLGDPTSDAPIIPGTLVLLSQTITQAVFQFGSANGLAVTMTFQSSTSNGVAWADLISLPNQDFSGVQYATDAPPLGQTWIFREEFTNATDTEYSNTLTLNGLAPLFAGTISHVTSGLLLGMA